MYDFNYKFDKKKRRLLQLSSVIRKEVSSIVSSDSFFMCGRSVVVSRVVLSPDFNKVTIYLAPAFLDIGHKDPSSSDVVESAIDELNAGSHIVYRELKSRVRVRHLPKLNFAKDF